MCIIITAGDINVRVAVKKPKMKDDFEPKLKLSKECMQTKNCGEKVIDGEEEFAFILGHIKDYEENLSPQKNKIQEEGENQTKFIDVEYVKRNKLGENCFGSTKLDKMDYEECGISLMEIDKSPVVVPNATWNLTVEDVQSSVVKNEVKIESVFSHKDDKVGIREIFGFGGTENEIFLGKDHGVKIEVDPLLKVHYPLDQIKNYYGEYDFSDIDNAKVLHNLVRMIYKWTHKLINNNPSEMKHHRPMMEFFFQKVRKGSFLLVQGLLSEQFLGIYSG